MVYQVYLCRNKLLKLYVRLLQGILHSCNSPFSARITIDDFHWQSNLSSSQNKVITHRHHDIKFSSQK